MCSPIPCRRKHSSSPAARRSRPTCRPGGGGRGRDRIGPVSTWTARKTPDQLIAAFDDWSPVVRGWAAEELAAAGGGVDGARADPPGGGRRGACPPGRARRWGASRTAASRVDQPADHDDRWVRYKAAEAVQKLGGAAKPAVPDLLGAVARTGEPLEPVNWVILSVIAHGHKALFQGR
ncbi:MAG: hypothetical protein U1F77_10930 [Kiritimatiellia bacterium]